MKATKAKYIYEPDQLDAAEAMLEYINILNPRIKIFPLDLCSINGEIFEGGWVISGISSLAYKTKRKDTFGYLKI